MLHLDDNSASPNSALAGEPGRPRYRGRPTAPLGIDERDIIRGGKFRFASISGAGDVYRFGGESREIDREELNLFRQIAYVVVVAVFAACASPCQQTSNDQSQVQEKESKRILGIVPNFRTSPSLVNYEPLTTREKFKVASQDAFDRGTFALAAIFAGEGQLTNANRSFGQGVAGYGRYYGAAYGDLLIGDYMTEAVFPTLLHQDPRYFRRGTGTGWSRLGYAMGQIFWTHTDSGGTQFNYSEIAGNSVAVAISTAYYANNRTAGDAVSKLGTQLGVDMGSNILKEFWPEIQRKLHRRH